MIWHSLLNLKVKKIFWSLHVVMSKTWWANHQLCFVSIKMIYNPHRLLWYIKLSLLPLRTQYLDNAWQSRCHMGSGGHLCFSSCIKQQNKYMHEKNIYLSCCGSKALFYSLSQCYEVLRKKEYRFKKHISHQ